MSNTETMELSSAGTVTLFVDRGGHVERLSLDTYPLEYDVDGSRVCRAGYPTPIGISIDDEIAGERHSLYTEDEVATKLDYLQDRVLTVMQAAVVNDKQRKALEDIINGYFVEESMNLWRFKD